MIKKRPKPLFFLFAQPWQFFQKPFNEQHQGQAAQGKDKADRPHEAAHYRKADEAAEQVCGGKKAGCHQQTERTAHGIERPAHTPKQREVGNAGEIYRERSALRLSKPQNRAYLTYSTTMSAPGRERWSTVERKLPVMRSRLGSSARKKVGMPTQNMLISVSCIGVKG